MTRFILTTFFFLFLSLTLVAESDFSRFDALREDSQKEKDIPKRVEMMMEIARAYAAAGDLPRALNELEVARGYFREIESLELLGRLESRYWELFNQWINSTAKTQEEKADLEDDP
ncbi:MAG: hypothetical protein HQL31_07335, partial [Planctomycetes bacterium]|nr:hypothetical protein [Planctomycetota bacterium]